MPILNWFKNLFNSAENGAAEEFGELENDLHRPLYPICFYWSVVVPNKLIRGSWPVPAELKELHNNAFQNVVNLCKERSQDEEVVAAGLTPVNLPILDNTVPNPEQVRRFLNVCKSGPTYVHCEAGKGRTGCMVAAYRVKLQGWSPKAALAEADHFGLGIPAQRDWILKLK